MSESPRTSGPQFRADRAAEQEAVRTTIVGGRPPGSGQSVGDIPRGIEILVKKAAVDPKFKELLLSKRAEAADEIGLKLDPAEAMMLQAAPAEQLEVVIDRTVVPREHRRVFLGKAAAAMLAALGLGQAGCQEEAVTGSRPDYPAPTGSAPDMPPDPEETPADGSAEGAADSDQADEKPATEQPNDSPPDQTIRGIRPDRVPAPTGSRPDLPPSSEPE